MTFDPYGNFDSCACTNTFFCTDYSGGGGGGGGDGGGGGGGGGDPECAPSEVENEDGACVPLCDLDETWTNGVCEPNDGCEGDYVPDENGDCVDPDAPCPEGQVESEDETTCETPLCERDCSTEFEQCFAIATIGGMFECRLRYSGLIADLCESMRIPSGSFDPTELARRTGAGESMHGKCDAESLGLEGGFGDCQQLCRGAWMDGTGDKSGGPALSGGVNVGHISVGAQGDGWSHTEDWPGFNAVCAAEREERRESCREEYDSCTIDQIEECQE